jgi:hypothetical protein
MSFSQLPDDAIIEALEHADPQSIVRLTAVRIYVIIRILELTHIRLSSQTSKRVNDIINQSSTLRYPLEITRARMIDGPPNHITSNMRLAQFRSHQAAWSTLQTALIAPPFVLGHWTLSVGLSNGYMIQIRNNNAAFPWAVDVYKLHNPFGRNRVRTIPMTRLPQTVIVDSTQTVVVMNMIDEDLNVK